MIGFEDFDNPYRAPEVPFEVVRRVRASWGVFLGSIVDHSSDVGCGSRHGCCILQCRIDRGNRADSFDCQCFWHHRVYQETKSSWHRDNSFRPGIQRRSLFWTIYLLDWTPAKAQGPVPMMAFTYMMVFCAAALVALWQTRSLRVGGSTQASKQISEMPR